MVLLDRLRNKDENALIELMKLYGDYLTRTAYLLVRDRHLAEELVQDTFVIAFQKIFQLEEESKLKGWLTSIVMNLARSHMRKWSFKNISLTLDSISFTLKNAEWNEPENLLLEGLNNITLHKEIQNLSYKYKEIIVLFYYNELKTSEIAELLNMKENTVKSLLKRGRNMLKENLLKGGYEHG